MKIFNHLQYLILFSSSIFAISTRFASPPASTLYVAVGGCCALAIMSIVLKYKQPTLSVSATELLLGSFLLFTSIYGAFINSILKY